MYHRTTIQDGIPSNLPISLFFLFVCSNLGRFSSVIVGASDTREPLVLDNVGHIGQAVAHSAFSFQVVWVEPGSTHKKKRGFNWFNPPHLVS